MARTLAAVATLAKDTQASWKQHIMAVSASRGRSTTTAVSGMQHTHTWRQTGSQVTSKQYSHREFRSFIQVYSWSSGSVKPTFIQMHFNQYSSYDKYCIIYGLGSVTLQFSSAQQQSRAPASLGWVIRVRREVWAAEGQHARKQDKNKPWSNINLM